MKIGNKEIPSALINGLCVLLGAMISSPVTAYLTIPKVYNLEIKIVEKETWEPVDAYIYVDMEIDKRLILSREKNTLILSKGNHTITVEHPAYKTETFNVDNTSTSRVIELTRNTGNLSGFIQLSLADWSVEEVETARGTDDNEILINGMIPSGTGRVYNTNLPLSLRGRILVLFFSNTGQSSFDDDRMVKLTYNQDSRLLTPTNFALRHGEYLPVVDTAPDRGVVFAIPQDFNGELNFVFYQAILSNLKLAAYYF